MNRLQQDLRSTMFEHDWADADGSTLMEWARRKERRRRLALPAAVAASVIILAVAAVVAFVPSDRDRGTQLADAPSQVTSSPAAARTTVPPAGWQDVTYGGRVHIQVPGSWKIPDVKCGIPQSDTVIFQFAGQVAAECGSPADSGRPAVVRFTYAGDSDFVHFPTDRATQQVVVDGHPAKLGRFAATILVIIPTADTMISISATDRDLREAIFDSISIP